MISIVIPVLNEAESIGKLITHINRVTAEDTILEILVVDGGSNDNTVQIVKSFAEKIPCKISVLTSEKGRARQMNTGAAAAQGEILYFLHADSLPPKHFDKHIFDAVFKQQHPAGCFRMKFDHWHPVLKVSEWFTRFNFKFCRGGDQSLFITKEAFNILRGFNEAYIIYEDCEFINRIYDRFGFKIIPHYIITSSRKYRELGTWKLQYHFALIHIKKRRGATPQELYKYYQTHIQKVRTNEKPISQASNIVSEN
jgi:rSAM/selenodomain-associated transferase 2